MADIMKESKQIIRDAMAEEKVTQIALANAMGWATQQAVGRLISKKHSHVMRLDSFVKMLDIMGFEVVVRKKKNIGKVEEWGVEVPCDTATDE